MSAPKALVFGSTGAVGSEILSALISSAQIPSIQTISRRQPTATSPKLTATLESDTSKWGSLIPADSSIVFNAVGTTRGAVGLKQQWAIDHDLCIEVARAAKAAGVKTYVFISSAGTRGFLSGYVPYAKMKVGVEDAIKEMGFENAVIVRPGMILGEREVPKAPVAEKIVGSLHMVSRAFQDSIGQHKEIIGRAAVAAALLAAEGKAPSKHWVVEQADVVRLGRDEWKTES